MSTPIEQNTIDLREILNEVNLLIESGGIPCTLTVATAEGALVEATLGSKKVSATAGADGTAILILNKEGLWTVSATLDGETKSTEILVEHNVEESLTFFPEEPSAYNQLALITSSQTWTAPENGWFQIEVFGASGNGGVGTGYSNSPRGGGGGGGGYSASRISLNKGDTIVLTVGAVGSTTKAIIDSSHNNSYDHTLQVTSGANGTSGSSLTGAGPGGAGGTASGGNYTNKNGGNGADGGTGGAGGTAGYTGGNVGGAGTTSKTVNAGAKGFIKIYRGNTNSGGGGGSNNPTFTVVHNGQNYTYEFESGMSFEQFVNSSYNDGSFSIGTANVLWNISNATVPNAVMFNSAALCTSVFDPAVFTLDTMVINSDEANVDNRMIVADKTYYCAATW